MSGDGEDCLRLACCAALALCLVFAACGGDAGRPSAKRVAKTAAPADGALAARQAVDDLENAYRYQIADDGEDDDRIRTYGHEAGQPDRREVVALVGRYYAAAAADDGAKACALMQPILAKAVPHDYGKGNPSLSGDTCGVVLTKFFRQLPGQPIANLGTTKVIGVRIAGGRGYAQLTSRLIPTGVIAVQRYRGSWTVDSLIGAGCRKCYAGRVPRRKPRGME